MVVTFLRFDRCRLVSVNECFIYMYFYIFFPLLPMRLLCLVAYFMSLLFSCSLLEINEREEERKEEREEDQ